MSDAPDIQKLIPKTDAANKPQDKGTDTSQPKEGLVGEFLHSVAYSALQAPLNGVTQLVDAVSGQDYLPKVQFISSPGQAKFGSADWHAEQIGSAVGMLLPFLVVGKGVRSVIGEGALASAETGLMSERSAIGLSMKEAGLTGFTYSALFQPANVDPHSGLTNFFAARALNGVTGAGTFMIMNGTSLGLNRLAESSALKGSFSFLSPVLKNSITAGVLSGVPAGAFTAETDSLINNHKLASATDLGQSIYGMSVIGGALGVTGMLRAERQGSGQSNYEYLTSKIKESLGRSGSLPKPPELGLSLASGDMSHPDGHASYGMHGHSGANIDHILGTDGPNSLTTPGSGADTGTEAQLTDPSIVRPDAVTVVGPTPDTQSAAVDTTAAESSRRISIPQVSTERAADFKQVAQSLIKAARPGASQAELSDFNTLVRQRGEGLDSLLGQVADQLKNGDTAHRLIADAYNQPREINVTVPPGHEQAFQEGAQILMSAHLDQEKLDAFAKSDLGANLEPQMSDLADQLGLSPEARLAIREAYHGPESWVPVEGKDGLFVPVRPDLEENFRVGTSLLTQTAENSSPYWYFDAMRKFISADGNQDLRQPLSTYAELTGDPKLAALVREINYGSQDVVAKGKPAQIQVRSALDQPGLDAEQVADRINRFHEFLSLTDQLENSNDAYLSEHRGDLTTWLNENPDLADAVKLYGEQSAHSRTVAALDTYFGTDNLATFPAVISSDSGSGSTGAGTGTADGTSTGTGVGAETVGTAADSGASPGGAHETVSFAPGEEPSLSNESPAASAESPALAAEGNNGGTTEKNAEILGKTAGDTNGETAGETVSNNEAANTGLDSTAITPDKMAGAASDVQAQALKEMGSNDLFLKLGGDQPEQPVLWGGNAPIAELPASGHWGGGAATAVNDHVASQIVIGPRGETIRATYAPNANHISFIEDSNTGTRTTAFDDGRQVVNYANGAVASVMPDGSYEVNFPNGNYMAEYAAGPTSRVVVDNGVVYNFNRDGTVSRRVLEFSSQATSDLVANLSSGSWNDQIRSAIMLKDQMGDMTGDQFKQWLDFVYSAKSGANGAENLDSMYIPAGYVLNRPAVREAVSGTSSDSILVPEGANPGDSADLARANLKNILAVRPVGTEGALKFPAWLSDFAANHGANAADPQLPQWLLRDARVRFSTGAADQVDSSVPESAQQYLIDHPDQGTPDRKRPDKMKLYTIPPEDTSTRLQMLDKLLQLEQYDKEQPAGEPVLTGEAINKLVQLSGQDARPVSDILFKLSPDNRQRGEYIKLLNITLPNATDPYSVKVMLDGIRYGGRAPREFPDQTPEQKAAAMSEYNRSREIALAAGSELSSSRAQRDEVNKLVTDLLSGGSRDFGAGDGGRDRGRNGAGRGGDSRRGSDRGGSRGSSHERTSVTEPSAIVESGVSGNQGGNGAGGGGVVEKTATVDGGDQGGSTPFPDPTLVDPSTGEVTPVDPSQPDKPTPLPTDDPLDAAEHQMGTGHPPPPQGDVLANWEEGGGVSPPGPDPGPLADWENQVGEIDSTPTVGGGFHSLAAGEQPALDATAGEGDVAPPPVVANSGVPVVNIAPLTEKVAGLDQLHGGDTADNGQSGTQQEPVNGGAGADQEGPVDPAKSERASKRLRRSQTTDLGDDSEGYADSRRKGYPKKKGQRERGGANAHRWDGYDE